MISVDAGLSDDERTVLAFLLDFYRTQHTLPTPQHIEHKTGVPYTPEFQKRMVRQFHRRGMPYPNEEAKADGRLLRFLINEAFTTGSVPDVNEAGEAMQLSQPDLQRALRRMQQRQMVTVESDKIELAPMLRGAFVHQAILAGGFETHGACAVDVLGVPFMFGCDATVHSRTFDGQPVTVEIQGGRITRSEPDPLWVSWNASDPVCGNTHFFESESAFQAWRQEHPDRPEELIPLPKALKAGQAWFEGRLSLDFTSPTG